MPPDWRLMGVVCGSREVDPKHPQGRRVVRLGAWSEQGSGWRDAATLPRTRCSSSRNAWRE